MLKATAQALLLHFHLIQETQSTAAQPMQDILQVTLRLQSFRDLGHSVCSQQFAFGSRFPNSAFNDVHVTWIFHGSSFTIPEAPVTLAGNSHHNPPPPSPLLSPQPCPASCGRGHRAVTGPDACVCTCVCMCVQGSAAYGADSGWVVCEGGAQLHL